VKAWCTIKSSNSSLNILKADMHYDKIKIETRKEDKITENQEQAFLRDYFSKS